MWYGALAMRNMSFSHTVAQVRDGTKTVTRRLGWSFLRPGDVVMACKKCQGLRKGEKVKRIRPIRVVSVRREKLCDIPASDLRKEGFPNVWMSVFIEMFCKINSCRYDTVVNRIEFEYLEDDNKKGGKG